MAARTSLFWITAFLWTACSTTAAAAQSEPVRHSVEQETTSELFNGINLDGWDGDPNRWSVVSGTIRGANSGSVPSSTYLFTKKSYREFRLIFEVKQTRDEGFSSMHSAVCALGERFTDVGENRWGFKGPLIMVCNDWGIWDAYRRNRTYPANHRGQYRVAAENVGDWNRVEILVTGNRIRQVVNGQLAMDFTDSAEMLQPSPIGLQLHKNDRPQEFRFRNLVISEAPNDKLLTLRKPNILFIMSDDHAATGIGAYGSRLAPLNPTPNIDRLASEGVRLANCFCTNSICTPSRATIMTGQYSHKNGVHTLIGRIPVEKQTLSRLMKEAGYETAIVGKWHLAAEPATFDFYSVLPGQGWYHNPEFRVRGPLPWPKNTKRVKKHSSDAITDISLNWLKERRQTEKPFFLMHHFKAPHDNFENAERYDFLYDDVDIPEPDSLRNRGKHGPFDRAAYGTSVSKRNKRRNMGQHMFVDKKLSDEDYTTQSYQRYLKKFLRCVKGVDDNVGRLIRYLEETGELENTIIVYTADQGFMLGEHDYIDKRWMYEESLRMPFIIRFPARFNGGTVNEDMINNVDFAPTLLELAGASESVAKLPPQSAMQGRSFVQNLVGTTPDDWPTASYYRYWMHMAHHDNPAHFGIRTQDQKLIFFYGRRLNDKWFWNPNSYQSTEPYWEFYDLKSDPHEMNNAINDPTYASTIEDLRAQLYELRAKIGDTDAQFPEIREMLQNAR